MRELHTSGFIHGDIRLSNIVFDRFGDAKLIDFDYAGRIGGTSSYLGDFNPLIPDGIRAKGAISAAIMEPSHDWEALSGALRICLRGTERAKEWEAALEALEHGDETKVEELRGADGNGATLFWSRQPSQKGN